MQDPHYKDVTLNAYTSAWTKTSFKSTNYNYTHVIEQCVGVLSSSARDQIRTWNCELMEKTPQIAKEQIVMTMDKAQETKLQRYKS